MIRDTVEKNEKIHSTRLPDLIKVCHNAEENKEEPNHCADSLVHTRVSVRHKSPIKTEESKRTPSAREAESAPRAQSGTDEDIIAAMIDALIFSEKMHRSGMANYTDTSASASESEKSSVLAKSSSIGSYIFGVVNADKVKKVKVIGAGKGLLLSATMKSSTPASTSLPQSAPVPVTVPTCVASRRLFEAARQPATDRHRDDDNVNARVRGESRRGHSVGPLLPNHSFFKSCDGKAREGKEDKNVSADLGLGHHASSTSRAGRNIPVSESSKNNNHAKTSALEPDSEQSSWRTPESRSQKYQFSKNHALYEKVDQTIESSVTASGSAEANTEQEIANKNLRRLVRMCFSALTVVFGAFDPDIYGTFRGGSGGKDGGLLFTDSQDSSAKEEDSTYSSLSVRSSVKRTTVSANSSASRARGEQGRVPVDEEKSAREKRPSVPIPVARMLWAGLIYRRGGLDLDPDCASIFQEKNMITTERQRAIDKRVQTIVDEVQNALVYTLGLVDVVSNYHEARSKSSIAGGGRSARNTHYSSIPDSIGAACASLCVNHDVHLLYGQSMAAHRPDIFFQSHAAYERYLYKNATTMSTWDPIMELNHDMADACIACIRNRHSILPVQFSSHFEYAHAVEKAPTHLLRCSRFLEVADLLAKKSFVRRKLRTIGFLVGTRAHIADIEAMNKIISDRGIQNIDMDSVFISSFKVIYDVLITFDQSNFEKGGFRGADDKSLARTVEIAEALHCMGQSMLAHGFEDDAVEAYSHSLKKFEKVHSVIQSGATENASIDGMPSLDHIQFTMAETLVGMATVNDCHGDVDNATINYERALSFYSKDRSLRHRNGVAETLMTMGIIYFRRKHWDIAAANFEEAMEILESLDVDGSKAEDIGDIFQWLGNIRRNEGESESALAFFTEALYVITLKFGKCHSRVGRVHQNIAIIYDDLRDFNASLSHYKEALKVRIRAAALAAKSTDLRHFEVATLEELAVAETLQCMGNVYRVTQDYERAYGCYSESAFIARLDVCALLRSNVLAVDRVMDLSRGDEADEGTASAVEILHDRLMKALEMARKLELQESEHIDDGKDESENDSLRDETISRKEQIAGILYDVGVISGAKFLLAIESHTYGKESYFLEEREKAHKCFKEVVLIRKERIRSLAESYCHGNPYDYGSLDQQMIIAFSLFEMGKLLSCTVLAHNRGSEPFLVDDTSRREIHSALDCFSDSRAILKKLHNNERCDDAGIARRKLISPVEIETTQTMAVLYREIDEYEKSVQCYKDLLNLHRNANKCQEKFSICNFASNGAVSEAERAACVIQSIGDVLRDQGDTELALDQYSEALKLRRSKDGGGLSIANNLRAIGCIHLERKEWALAAEMFEKELPVLVEALGEWDINVAYCYHHMGKAFEGGSDYSKALDFFTKAKSTMADSYLETDVNATNIFFDAGNMLLQIDKNSSTSAYQLEASDYNLALECLKLAYTRYRGHFGKDAIQTANSIFLLGELYYGTEEYKTAISCFEEALAVYKTKLGEKDVRTARTLNLIGLSFLESGEEDERAMECFDDCLAILQQNGHDRSEDHACVLFYKGAAHEKKNELDLAIVCYEGSLEYYQHLLCKSHIMCAVVSEKLGMCLLNDREPEIAKTHLEEALRIRKEHGSTYDLEAAEIYYGLGIVYCESRDYNKCLDFYEEAMRLRQEFLGDGHVCVAQVLNNVGSVFARNGEYDRAIKPWKDALGMYRDAGLSDDDQRVACTLQNISVSTSLVSSQSSAGKESSIRTFLFY